MQIGELQREEWASFCAGLNIVSPYQEPRWLDLVAEVYPRLHIRRLAAKDDDGRLLWLLPLIGIRPLGRLKWLFSSVAFGNDGGFLLPEGTKVTSPDSGSQLQNFLNREHAFAIELRNNETYGLDLRHSDLYSRFLLDLPSNTEALWSGIISGNARTAVRKARREGITVAWNPDTAMERWQDLNFLHAARHGTPVHHTSWYPAMARHYADDMEIAVAYNADGDSVAGAVLLHRGLRTVLHALAGGPLARKTAAADLIVWEAIVRSLVRGSRIFDFGRTRLDQGQLFFKRKWGGREMDFRFGYLARPGSTLPSVQLGKTGYSLGSTLWRCLPLAIQRHFGPILRVRIPA